MHLYLIRHGESLVNLADWPHGNRDEGLTPLGQRQARAVADRIAGDPGHVDAVYASTMKRALETATVIADTMQITPVRDDRIREIGSNRLDHAPWPDLPTDYGDFWAASRPFASVTPAVDRGESLMHFRTRVGDFVESVLRDHAGGTVVAVTHGGVVDVVFDHMFNVGPWSHCQVWTANAAVTHVEAIEAIPDAHGMVHEGPERWRLHRHNCVGHLQHLAHAPSVSAAHAQPAPGQ